MSEIESSACRKCCCFSNATMLKTVHAQKRVACLKDETDSADWSSMTDSIYDSSRLPSSLEDKNLLSNISETTTALHGNIIESSKDLLFGRSKEIIALEDAFLSLQQNNNEKFTDTDETRLSHINSFSNHRSIAIVHGISGSSKTALVEYTLRQLTTDSQGFFVSGKFEANAGVREPHAAILEAFSDLCDLTIQSSDFVERKKNIQLEMGKHSTQLLEKAISNLRPLLEDDLECNSDYEEASDVYNSRSGVNNTSAFAKFKVACRSFLKSMTSKEHSIVLFLDDIQWMDNGSKQLLSFFLNDSELTNIMFVLAYRDEDEDSIIEFVQEIQSLPNTVNIRLENLEGNAVQNLLTNTLGSNTPSIDDLSNVIATKTRGNPFHVMQFLAAIQREGLMTFNSSASTWEFDVDEIQREFMVSETLAGLLALRVKRLSSEVQESLKIASLLGYRFDETLVIQVVSSLSEANSQSHAFDVFENSVLLPYDFVTSSLSEARKEGFIEKTKDGYQFSHDKIQMAFMTMIDKDCEGHYHLIIGKAYLARDTAESMYHAAVHLYQAPSYATTESSRLDLAHIHLKAAEYCSEMSAFQDAAELLHHGLELLNPYDKWTKHYDLAYQLTEMLSKMELIIGNHESCQANVQDVLSRATTTAKKVNALLINVECCMACNEMDATIVAANQALTLLGVKMPKKITIRHVIMKLIQVKVMLGRKSDDYILNLPKMNDESMATTVRLLLHLYMYCLLKNEDLQGLYSALLATELTLRGGLNPYAASAFTIYGFAELSNGNYRQAYRFGKLSILLLDKFKNRDAECPTIGLALTSLTHWFDPIRDMHARLLQAANRGFEIGDVVYGTFCISMCYGMQLWLGENLEYLEAFFRSTYQRIRDLSQDAMIMWAQPALQFVLNLRNLSVDDWRDLTNLTGEIMNETSFIEKAIESNHPTLVTFAWTYKAQISCIFGQWAKAESIYKEMMSLSEAFYFSYGVMISSLFGGIASYSLYKENKHRRHLKFARRHRNFLYRAHVRGCPNASAFLMLLNAEELSHKKSSKLSTTTTAYDLAIQTFATEKLPNFEALANERAGYYQVACSQRMCAEKYFDRALELYQHEWGAFAKHDWLAEEVEKVLSRMPFDFTNGLEIPNDVE